MAKQKQTEDTTQASASKELVQALVEAIQLTRPVEKKNAANRIPKSPWDPKDGSKKIKLRRKHYQHGLTVDPDYLDNEALTLLNKLKPGRYLSGYVKVFRRKDNGIDIDYPVKTASQRMRLISQFGIRDFTDLIRRCVDEAADPAKYQTIEEDLG